MANCAPPSQGTSKSLYDSSKRIAAIFFPQTSIDSLAFFIFLFIPSNLQTDQTNHTLPPKIVYPLNILIYHQITARISLMAKDLSLFYAELWVVVHRLSHTGYHFITVFLHLLILSQLVPVALNPWIPAIPPLLGAAIPFDLFWPTLFPGKNVEDAKK